MIRRFTPEAGSKKFDILGFLVGFLFPQFGLLAALIFSKDANFKKWALVGFGLL
jgi:hypothetical protein